MKSTHVAILVISATISFWACVGIVGHNKTVVLTKQPLYTALCNIAKQAGDEDKRVAVILYTVLGSMNDGSLPELADIVRQHRDTQLSKLEHKRTFES